MNKKWIIGGAILGVLVVIAGIMDATGMLDDVDPAPAAAPAVESAASPNPAELQESRSELEASLDAQYARWDVWKEAAKSPEYVEAVRAVEPAFVDGDNRIDRQASRTVNTCDDIARGGEGEELANRVVKRMSGGTATIDTDQAEELVAAMREHVCPDAGA